MFIYYQILGLDENAKDQEIRNRYLELVRKFTPEQHPESFMRITKAYEAIKDRRSRIKSKVMGLKDYRLWTEALTDLVKAIDLERKSPGLGDILEADKNE